MNATQRIFDMLRAAEKVRRFVKGMKQEEFVADEVLRDAVERNAEIIGEAARKVSEAFKNQHPEIPWRKDGCSTECAGPRVRQNQRR